jgi:Cof subfamily protein (haloacid dehalogenase superfamily)
MKKAVILDLDGTLFNSKRAVSNQNRDALRQCRDQGILIIIATARPLRTVVRRIPPEMHGDYMVLCNGAWVVKEGAVILRNELPARDVKRIVTALCNMGLSPAIEAEDCFYTDGERDPNFIGSYFTLDAFPNIAACKVLAYSPAGLDEHYIRQSLGDGVSCVVTDGRSLLQVSARTVSKLSACAGVLQAEGVALADTYAFGDDNNDISVFEAVGCGIAMANATSGLQSVAKHITGSNDEHGVATGLRKYVFNQDA